MASRGVGAFPYRLVLLRSDGSEEVVALYHLAVPFYPFESFTSELFCLDDGSWWTIEEIRDVRWAIDMWNLKPDDRLATLVLRAYESPPPDISEATPLQRLVGAYFHQDWALEGANALAVLDRFVHDSTCEDVVATLNEARELLTRSLSEEELEAVLDGWGLEYDPAYEGLTHRQWLTLVVDRLSESQRKT